jgi:predicted nucleotidyltransferase component of viral defense system
LPRGTRDESLSGGFALNAQPPDPVAHSVHDRLLHLATSQKEDFNAILVRYGNERLLYRLSRTRHSKQFILKGAALFVLWLGRIHRPTRDLDLLATEQIDESILTAVFKEVCTVSVKPDGLRFDPASVGVTEIREGQTYHGLRVKLRGFLGTARLNLQVDIGIGDTVAPKPKEAAYPTLLDMPAPHLKVYPRETTIAEKLDAMLERGIKNSRMKDYYDIVLLADHFAFDGKVLQAAIEATLKRRGRNVPDHLSDSLSDKFGHDASKSLQWNAFIRNNRLDDAPINLLTTVRRVRKFLEPVLNAMVSGTTFVQHWLPGGPWQ